MEFRRVLFRSGDREELIEFRESIRLDDTGLRTERAVAQKNADAIYAKFFHTREVTLRCVRIKLFPDLRRPTSPGSIISHAERNERLAVPGLKAPAIGGDMNLAERRCSPEDAHIE